MVLYALASDQVRGFAFTLGLSTIIDLVMVFLFTHPLVHVLSGTRTFTSPRVLRPRWTSRPGRAERLAGRPRRLNAYEGVLTMPGTGFSGSGALGRLYRGDTNFDFIGSRKRWYAASAIIIVVCILSIVFRGFNFGIDFAGGDSYQLPVRPGVTLADVRGAVTSAGVDVSSAQTAGVKGSTSSFVIDTEHQAQATVDKIKANLVTAGHLSNQNQIATNQVSKSWGGEVTRQAVIALDRVPGRGQRVHRDPVPGMADGARGRSGADP